jgi:hypothetical protein
MLAKYTDHSVTKYACKRYSLQCHEVCLQNIQTTVSRSMLAKDTAYSVTKYACKRYSVVPRSMLAKDSAYSVTKYACKRYSLQYQEVCLQNI